MAARAVHLVEGEAKVVARDALAIQDDIAIRVCPKDNPAVSTWDVAESDLKLQGARCFGDSSPKELKDLERNAVGATVQQMAKAAAFLQRAFDGQYFAWFGGWLSSFDDVVDKLPRDLDLLVLANGVGELRTTLSSWPWFVSSTRQVSATSNHQSRPSCHFGR